MQKKSIQTSMFFWLLGLTLLLGAEGDADKIVLKDGKVQISDRVWETEHYVHFILPGTQNVEIRYAKEIVERIEPSPNNTGRVPQAHPTPPKPPIDPGDAPQKKAPSTAVASKPADAVKAPAVSIEPLQQIVKQNKGLSFYDPRRPKRYWALRNSKHTELGHALDAIAKPYGRSAEWVARHMGQENDLGMIHKNLVRQLQSEMGESAPVDTAKLTEQGRTIEKVSEANSIKADEPSRIVEEPPGQVRPRINQAGSGVRFYDPRREQKYWSSHKQHHDTLKEALNALARQYGVTSEWIETHMGETNDLAIIHRNIEAHLNIE